MLGVYVMDITNGTNQGFLPREIVVNIYQQTAGYKDLNPRESTISTNRI